MLRETKRQKEVYFKELARVIVEQAILKHGGHANRLKISGVDFVALSPKAVWKPNFFLFGDPWSFLLQPSADWMRPLP